MTDVVGEAIARGLLGDERSMAERKKGNSKWVKTEKALKMAGERRKISNRQATERRSGHEELLESVRGHAS